ncbi:MAG: hemolysin family protein [Spirochaetes bacterium]|jgi:putative hemolysin|nr:hemolysin family protein [Spirochaetota bacterium]
MENYYLEIIIVGAFLFLSAFFSASETALFSLKKSDIHRFSLSNRKAERGLFGIMNHPEKILITILIGNLFVNLIISAIMTKMLLVKFGEYGHLISIALVTPFLIIFCEISPKILSINNYLNLSKRFYPLLNIFHHLFYPLRFFLLLITDFTKKSFGLKLSHKSITEDELDNAVTIGEEIGVIEKQESEFIKNVMRFSKKEASNVMFPRNRAIFIQFDSTIKDAISVFLKNNIIRAPVYRGDLDHVVGMLDSRDLMPYYLGLKKSRNITRFINEIKFFPASRELNDLLKDFLAEGIQMAVVVDEYGGTAGVVTLNSILSELMGSKFNRWESDIKTEFRKIGDEVFVLPGDMQISDFNHNFEENVESVNSDTIGGFIIEQIGHIPKRGETITTESHIIRIRNIRKNRIESIELINRK